MNDDVTDDGVFDLVRDGYEAVYDALSHGETFNRIWRENAYGASSQLSSPTSAS